MKTAERKKDIWEKVKASRLRDWLTIAGVAIVLCMACFFILNKEKIEETAPVTSIATEEERRLATLLEEIDGIDNVRVMIGTTDEGDKSVVVVCVGDKHLQMIMDVREAAAAAVGVQEKNVKVYMKEN